MKLAIIPWSNSELQDSLFFYEDEKGNRILRDNNSKRLREEFIKYGHEVHTIDCYETLEEIDEFLFFVPDWKLVKKIMKLGMASRMVYCNAEPPTVTWLNTPKGYKILKQIFPYILTWNLNWVDNRSVFKRNIPYVFQKENMGTVKFEDRKLLTGISGNKKSNYADELYSEREKVYTFFEKNYPQDFTFYGTGWDKKKHSCYGGKVADKSETYHNYKFAVCFENTKNVKGYITEKIFDCICSGIVPIYAGADDITDYVPRECFIDYFEFTSYEELAQFLKNMPESEYEKYLDAAKNLLKTNIQDKFSGEEYARDIMNAVSYKKNFKPTLWGESYVNLMVYSEVLIANIKKVYRKVWKNRRKVRQ